MNWTELYTISYQAIQRNAALFSVLFVFPFFSSLPLLALLIPCTHRPTADRKEGSKDQKGRMSKDGQRSWQEEGLSKREKRGREEEKKRVTGNHRYIFSVLPKNARPETWVLGEGVRRDQGWAWRRRYLNERRRAGKKRQTQDTNARDKGRIALALAWCSEKKFST
ncbi:hypothetical protein HDV63DRAFT_283657 [Trichoderma sp. SZMC 28014]